MHVSEDTKWEFGDAGKQVFGLSDASVTTFAKKSSFGRESAQNSIGARQDHNKPVKVVYSLIELHGSQIPGRKNLKDRLISCKTDYLDIQQESTGGEVDILDDAIKCLDQEIISCLVISDYNTKGLSGKDDDKTGNFRRFITQGISIASGDSAGSFGQGKNALFIASSTRSIYVTSTLAQEEGENDYPFLEFGVSRLCTHKEPGTPSKMCENIGYISDTTKDAENERFVHPFRYNDFNQRPAYIANRTEPGTDILLIGYKYGADKNWIVKLAADLIEAFFLSIYDEKICFEIIDKDGSKISITKDTLSETLEQVKKLATEGDSRYLTERQFQELPIGNIRGQIKAIKEGVKFTKELKTVSGNIDIRVFSDNNDSTLTNKSSIHRNPGMTIYHTAKGGTKLKRFNCIVHINSSNNANKQDANYYMVQMEDPTHTELNVDNIRDGRVVKTKAANLKTEINGFLIECLESFHRLDDSGDDAPGLSRYLPCIDLDEKQNIQNKDGYTPNDADEKCVDPFTSKAKETPKSDFQTSQYIEKNEQAELGQSGRKYKRTSVKKTKAKGGKPSGGTTSTTAKQSDSSSTYLKADQDCQIRIICPNQDFSQYRVIILSPSRLKGDLLLKISGEDSNNFSELFLLSARRSDGQNQDYKLDKNCIKDIEIEPNKALSIDILTKFNIPIAFEV
jgi:hypothetical protein